MSLSVTPEVNFLYSTHDTFGSDFNLWFGDFGFDDHITLFPKLKCQPMCITSQFTKLVVHQIYCIYGNYYKLNIVPQATLGSDLNYKMNAYICQYNVKVVTSPTTVIW